MTLVESKGALLFYNAAYDHNSMPLDNSAFSQVRAFMRRKGANGNPVAEIIEAFQSVKPRDAAQYFRA